VLVVAPFAEEMNKSRRLLTEVACALADRGVATVLVDAFGTGDSAGEFRDADWNGWREDLARVAAWTGEEGWPVAALLGVRTGCILGAQLAREIPGRLRRSVFWQPVLEGDRFLTQFLRLRVAASMMEAGGKETTTELRERLRRGEVLEIAGYDLSDRLASQLEGLHLATEITQGLGDLHWIEVVRGTENTLPTASERAVAAVRESGLDVQTYTVPGEPFWSSTEIVLNPQLVARTVDVLASLT
jgi:exosortase A-associated hydrolase 2